MGAFILTLFNKSINYNVRELDLKKESEISLIIFLKCVTEHLQTKLLQGH